jgi:CheY-like chemotaxis protein
VTQFTIGDLPVATSAPVNEAGLQVLLVDDNPTALASGAAMMRSLGWHVTAVDTGEQALDLVRLRLENGQTPFQAFFVDWQMPGLDGWQTLREVRRLYGEREAPVLVMLSGQGRELLAQRSHREVELLNGFLVKPLTASMLKNALAHAHDTPTAATTVATDDGITRARVQRLAGMRILVVEDNAINQQVAKELLSHEGAQITLADNGRIGVDTVAGADPQFDVVLMDLQMPVMGGLDAARAIRLGLGLTQLPVIAMTANAMASDREACLEAGMNDHVGKPFDLNHLVDTLVRHTQWIGCGSVAAGIAPASAAAAMVWPEGIEGAGALARMGGNTALLVKTMRSFARQALHLPGQLDALAKAGDAVVMRRELHALKGLAATLGVVDLAALAAQAEALLRQDASPACQDSPMPELLVAIGRCIGEWLPVLESLATQLSLQITSLEPAASPASPDGVVLLDQLRELLRVLRNADMTAMEMHATLRQSGGDALDDAMAPLDAAMAELEFELAAAECEILISQLTQ